MKYVTIVANKDGIQPAVTHDNLDAAQSWVRAYLTGAKNKHAPDAEELIRMESDIVAMRGLAVESIQGSIAWKELVYITPFMGPAPVIKKTQKRII